MRLGGVAVVKNEADIVEVFVRHNLRFLDVLHVVDNHSTDGTYQILEALRDEGLPLILGRDARTDHPQADILSAILGGWCEAPDWVFCLDADEFIDADSVAGLRAEVASLSGDVCHTAGWVFFVPTAADDPGEANPTVRIGHRRDAEVDMLLRKVVVPARFLGSGGIRVGAGSHALYQSNGVQLPQLPSSGLRLGHFPIRSHDQLAKKVVVGDWATSARATRVRSENSHWALLKTRVLAGEVLGRDELSQLAYHYARPTEEVLAVSQQRLVRQPLLPPDFDLRHTGDRLRPFVADVVAFADDHFAALRRVALDAPTVTVRKTRFGLIADPGGASDDPQQEALARHGEWAATECEFLVDLLANGDAAIDVGAGIGTQTVALAARVGAAGSVIAFEADPRRHLTLAANLVLNGATDVTVERVDLVGAPRDRGPRRTGRLRTSVRALRSERGATLDDYQVPAADVLRLDVGAAVFDVLGGAGQTLARHRPIILVVGAQSLAVGDVVRWAGPAGYRCYWFLTAAFDPASFLGEPEQPGAEPDQPGAEPDQPGDEPEQPRVAIVCQPAEADPPAGLIEITGASDTWLLAWDQQGGQGNRPPTRWAMSGHGLDDRWR